MAEKDFWDLAYLIKISRGDRVQDAIDYADKALEARRKRWR